MRDLRDAVLAARARRRLHAVVTEGAAPPLQYLGGHTVAVPNPSSCTAH
jgi:hypothetical protein